MTALLALLGGILSASSAYPYRMPPLAFIGVAVFYWSLRHVKDERRWLQRACGLGFLYGFGANFVALFWVHRVLEEFANFPIIAAFATGSLLWTAQALPFMIATAFATGLEKRQVPLWLGLPLMWSVVPTLFPALFPWRLALSQLDFLPFPQIAEWGGAPLVDFLLVLTSCAWVEGIAKYQRLPIFVGALAFILPVAYGLVRLPQLEADRRLAEPLAIGVVQPNIPIRDKHNPQLFFQHLSTLREATRTLESAGAELVVWPESAYPYPLHRRQQIFRQDRYGILVDGVHGPVLTGAVTRAGNERFNSTVAIDAGGRIVGLADKVHLLAFGEYTPFWDYLPILQTHFRRGLTPGTGRQLLHVADTQLGILNCYEDILPYYVMEQARYRPDIWINVTNDAWFGDTGEPHLHHLAARLRAIETRRELIRSVNTGISGHVLANGADAVRTESYVPAHFVADARRLSGVTPWVRLGDWMTPTALFWFFGVLIYRRRTRTSTSHPA